jgi:DNA-binding transcriptional regulator of glucitol operon
MNYKTFVTTQAKAIRIENTEKGVCVEAHAPTHTPFSGSLKSRLSSYKL